MDVDVDEGVMEGWVVFGASYFGASWMGWALGWGLEVGCDFWTGFGRIRGGTWFLRERERAGWMGR